MEQGDEQNGFTFWRSFYEAAKELPDDQRLAFYDAIIKFGIDGMETELTGVPKSLFILIRPVLNKGKSRAKSGAKGGSKPEANGKQNESKPEANVNFDLIKKNKNKNINMNFKRERENEVQNSPPPILIPDNFSVSSEMMSWAKKESPECDVVLETKKFCEHHKGIGSLRVDWYATWRKWILQSANFTRTRDPTSTKSPPKIKPELFPTIRPEDQPAEWIKALSSIRAEVSEQSYKTWFKSAFFRSFNGGTLELEVPTETFRTCLMEKYKPIILKNTGAYDLKIHLFEARECE